MPTEVSVGTARTSDGTLWAAIVINTHQGTQTFFLDAEMAREIAQGLVEAADSAGSGLEIARPGLSVVKPGNGVR